MEGFSLSNNTDKNKVFLVNQSNLEGRFDSYFYKHDFQLMIESLNNSKYETVPFKKIIKSINNGFDFRNYKDDGIPYIKVANVKQGEFDFSKIQYIDFSSNEITKNIQLKRGNILLTRKGTYGNALSLDKDYDYVISSEVFYIELKTDLIDSKYLEIFFNSNIGQKQFNRVSIGAIMGSLSQEALKTLKIPLPPKDIQQQIIDLYQTAHNQKQQKEAQAAALLASIDTYLLNELGITLPEKDTSLKGRINSNVRLKDISGSRFDPMLYDKNTIALKEAIININENKFIAKPLKYFVIRSVAGDWGLDENDNINSDEFEKCLVIRATEFDNDYNLKLDNSRVKYRLIKKDKLDKIDIQENDLLIEKSGGSPDQPVGRISILTKEILDNNIICYSNFIHKIRVDNTKLIPQYLFCFLKTIHNIKLTEAMQSQTNGIRNLIMSTYLNQTIVLPIKSDGSFDLEKQTEIANHIQDIRTQAKQLQEEAKVVLEKAKKEVEKMILGE